MKVGTLVVGALIGGAVWVYALRATAAATRNTAGSPTGDSPPPDPGGVIRDGQGNIVGTVGETPPIISPPAGTTSLDGTGQASTTTENMLGIAKSATDQTVVSAGSNTVAGVDGNTGSVLPLKTDPITQTVKVDDQHPLGGQGTEQMSSTPSGQSPPIIAPPAYADPMPAYNDYLTARYGTTNGMTQQQIDSALMEGAALGGLAL